LLLTRGKASDASSAPTPFEETMKLTFNCQDSSGLNPPTGQLKIEPSYTDHGSNALGSSYGIRGIVDKIDPVLDPQSV
jgi:hypothetical protein